jgi:hypothetical protein
VTQILGAALQRARIEQRAEMLAQQLAEDHRVHEVPGAIRSR